MSTAKASPEQNYLQQEGRVFLSGNQALVRLPIEHSRRDKLAGLNTGGFISGYRGSPLGHLDQDLWRVEKMLLERNIHFRSGVNEDTAATAVWGSQEAGFFDSKFDGVFGLWYSKGPGVDRSGDALRHANLWGTSPKGGVIMAVGDDPMSRSSSIQQQSEHTLAGLCIPVFNAANVQDIYDYGLIGWQLSRYAGVWVGIKSVSDIYESWYPVDTAVERNTARLPEDYEFNQAQVHTRWPDRSVDQDERMLRVRLPAVRAFARANALNRVTHNPAGRRLGIITTGKSWSDTLEALRDLGIDETQMADIGLSIFKVGLVWPLEPETLLAYTRGLDEVLVVEECRPILEPQIKDILYALPEGQRPRIFGKRDREGHDWLPSHGEITPVLIARALYHWLENIHRTEAMQTWVRFLDDTHGRLVAPRETAVRTPYFCSGCPHNTSTKVPEGSHQLAGIGCHWLATLMERGTVTYPHMGGEGINWVGASPFVNTEHMFVNVGDGTWFHSGSMALRQAVAANVRITYKILYNDAVAMTGGQPVDGPLSVESLVKQLEGESVKRIALVSVDPERHRHIPAVPGYTLHHRDDLDQVQRELREYPGVSAIIYEQTCATELRRRRGKKQVPDPARRVFINDRVCEGCGDCSVQSNCLSVQPLETEFGRKRVIDQSACNKDFSCLKGFCPSFVTIEGGSLKKGGGVDASEALFKDLPDPEPCQLQGVYGVIVTGIGGTGVVTIANLIGAAAQKEGKSTQALDLTGMAQKFGAVYCHLQISNSLDDLHATRLSVGKAHLLVGADLVVAASEESLSRLRQGVTQAIVNAHETVTGAFTRDVNFHLPIDSMKSAVADFCGDGRAHFYDSTELSRDLTGDTIGANMMLLGYAAQKGWLPVRISSLLDAITENGVAVPYNTKVFMLGRLLAADPEKVKALAAGSHVPRASLRLSQSIDELIDRRSTDLEDYQNAAYAARYRALVERVRKAEAPVSSTLPVTEAVARNLYKLMAYKDEYEVARLYSSEEFMASLKDQFTGDYQLQFHMAPPLLSRLDPATGRPKKRAFGPWMLKALGVLAKFRGLRGSFMDPFGYLAERRLERTLITEYEALIGRILDKGLSMSNAEIALELARTPELIRGYGPVKDAGIEAARKAQEKLAADLERGRISLKVAA
ncbi:MAG: indolepyruvate ferredoxin oxidoreductase family protein [Proteobacteria bacterium]|nr:indolepyruvate ferredoxin oxidoreductase family protein [Pseudomonadota bacterium]HQR03238.1 indolepyruvate ferredoxin oxidoreductase family protein [Rhodocyclaceae bacterium]